LDEPRTIGPFEKPNVFGSPHPKEKYYDYNQAIIGGIDRCCHARNTRHGSRELRSPTAPLSPPPAILRIRRTVIGTPHGVSNVEGIEAITE
jgi:hypothetical protein